MSNKYQLGKIYKVIKDNVFDYYRLKSIIKEAICIDLETQVVLPFVIREKSFYMDYSLSSKLETKEFSGSTYEEDKTIVHRDHDKIVTGGYYHISYTRPKTDQVIEYHVKVDRIDALLMFENRGDDPDYENYIVRFNKSTGKFADDDDEQVYIEPITPNIEAQLEKVVYPIQKTRVIVRPTAGLTDEQLKMYIVEFLSTLKSQGWSVYTKTKGTRLEERHFIPKVVFGFIGKEDNNGKTHTFKKSIKSIVEYIYDWFYITLDRDPTKLFKKTNFSKQVSLFINENKAKKLGESLVAITASTATASTTSDTTTTTTTTTTTSTTTSASAPVKDVFVETYSAASIAVFGNTKSFRDQLKKLGGKYNPHLTWQGKKQPGWIFPIKTRRALEQLFGMEVSEEMKQEAQRVRETVKRFLKSKIRTNRLKMVRIDNVNIILEHLDNDQIFSMWNRPHPISKKTLPEFTINKGIVFEYLFTWYKFYRNNSLLSLSALLREYNDYESGESSVAAPTTSTPSTSTTTTSTPSTTATTTPSTTTKDTSETGKEERRNVLISKFEAWMHRIEYPELKRLLLENIDNIEFWRRQPEEGATEEEQLAIGYLRKFYKKLKQVS